jgi:hypothetical protein
MPTTRLSDAPAPSENDATRTPLRHDARPENGPREDARYPVLGLWICPRVDSAYAPAHTLG